MRLRRSRTRQDKAQNDPIQRIQATVGNAQFVEAAVKGASGRDYSGVRRSGAERHERQPDRHRRYDSLASHRL
jgi:hypothetical protein